MRTRVSFPPPAFLCSPPATILKVKHCYADTNKLDLPACSPLTEPSVQLPTVGLTMTAWRLPVLYPSNINRCHLLSGVGSAAGSFSITEPQWRDLRLQISFQPLEGGRNTPLSYLDVTGALVTCTTCTSVIIYLFYDLLFFSLTFEPSLHTKKNGTTFSKLQ